MPRNKVTIKSPRVSHDFGKQELENYVVIITHTALAHEGIPFTSLYEHMTDLPLPSVMQSSKAGRYVSIVMLGQSKYSLIPTYKVLIIYNSVEVMSINSIPIFQAVSIVVFAPIIREIALHGSTKWLLLLCSVDRLPLEAHVQN